MRAHNPKLISSLLLPLLLAVHPVIASGPVGYTLGPSSDLEEGCFPPCLCPSYQPVPVSGGFDLAPIGREGEFDLYSVTGVDWHVPLFGRRVTGSGTLQVALNPERHRLTLDLSTNGGQIERYDSGVVEATSPFPSLDVVISKNRMRCFDTAIRVAAAPAGPTPLALTVTTADLSWTPMAGVVGYDVVYGDLADLCAGGGDFSSATRACLADDIAATTLASPQDPSPGEAIWFLVRDPAGGTWDTGAVTQAGGRDAAIATSPGSCP